MVQVNDTMWCALLAGITVMFNILLRMTFVTKLDYRLLYGYYVFSWSFFLICKDVAGAMIF